MLLSLTCPNTTPTLGTHIVPVPASLSGERRTLLSRTGSRGTSRGSLSPLPEVVYLVNS